MNLGTANGPSETKPNPGGDTTVMTAITVETVKYRY